MADENGVSDATRGALTEHERVRKQWGKSSEQAAEATADVRKLWGLPGAHEGGVMDVPVHYRWGRGVVKCMVGERVRVGALPIVTFLAVRD